MRINLNSILGRLDALYLCGKQRDGTYSRLAFSPEDLRARKLFMRYCTELGLGVRVDAAGNILARLPGKNNMLPAILIGSHLDTVLDGGKYDGVLGCLAGLEVAAALIEAGTTPLHPLEIAVFADEEGVRFGSGLFGSSAFCGLPLTQFSPKDIDIYGRTRQAVFEEAGIVRPENAARAKESVLCALELHVEQGGFLHKNNQPVGIVSSIAGVSRHEITIVGQANHAGSTLMVDRKDALVGAAAFIAAIPMLLRQEGTPFTVATVGSIQVEPNAVNVIPGRCVFSLELRDQSSARLEALNEALLEHLAHICATHALHYTSRPLFAHNPTPMHAGLRAYIEAACKALGYDPNDIPSGAFHDSLLLAATFPTGMLFIPSVNGISHSPDEYSTPEAIQAGCDVLLRTIQIIDKEAGETL